MTALADLSKQIMCTMVFKSLKISHCSSRLLNSSLKAICSCFPTTVKCVLASADWHSYQLHKISHWYSSNWIISIVVAGSSNGGRCNSKCCCCCCCCCCSSSSCCHSSCCCFAARVFWKCSEMTRLDWWEKRASMRNPVTRPKTLGDASGLQGAGQLSPCEARWGKRQTDASQGLAETHTHTHTPHTHTHTHTTQTHPRAQRTQRLWAQMAWFHESPGHISWASQGGKTCSLASGIDPEKRYIDREREQEKEQGRWLQDFCGMTATAYLLPIAWASCWSWTPEWRQTLAWHSDLSHCKDDWSGNWASTPPCKKGE